MKLLRGLEALIAALPELDGTVCLPLGVGAPEPEALSATRFLVLDHDEPGRDSWRPWLPTAVLAQVPWGTAPTGELVDAWFRPHSPVAVLVDRSCAESDIPDEYVIPAAMTPDERLRWWSWAVRLHTWQMAGDVTADVLRPATRIELAMAEHRLGVVLPESLRRYHLALGSTPSVEGILGLTGERFERVEPLADAYPGIVEMGLDHTRVDRLIAFGDYLGNGNQWCFDRADGSVWYFDHDGGRALTRMFDDPGDYLDALTVRAIGAAHDSLGRDDRSEDALVALLSEERVRTWPF
ncbi:SMI1/KNR4 family protein [Cellulomonas sp. NPDC089187]|uniref:SMI1/KNR4 family protein n=1 Tax=Cellulomonas sp. NPDC089187 TaxID=3154970 RepID=UPI00342F595B